jgi:hypothetical protein
VARKKPAKKVPEAKPKPPDEFAPIAKELALAYGRINGAPARRLKWLLNFSELNLDSLSEGHRANLRWEVVVFGLNKKPDEMKGAFDIFPEYTMLTDKEDKGASLYLVRKFQTTMREIFDKLFSGKQWRFRRPVQEEAITLPHTMSKPASGSKLLEVYYEASKEHPVTHNPITYTAEDLLSIQVIDLIKAEWQRLRLCQNPHCNRHPRFVAAKKGRAQFCSPQCSAYVRVNKKRGKL